MQPHFSRRALGLKIDRALATAVPSGDRRDSERVHSDYLTAGHPAFDLNGGHPPMRHCRELRCSPLVYTGGSSCRCSPGSNWRV